LGRRPRDGDGGIKVDKKWEENGEEREREGKGREGKEREKWEGKEQPTLTLTQLFIPYNRIHVSILTNELEPVGLD